MGLYRNRVRVSRVGVWQARYRQDLQKIQDLYRPYIIGGNSGGNYYFANYHSQIDCTGQRVLLPAVF